MSNHSCSTKSGIWCREEDSGALFVGHDLWGRRMLVNYCPVCGYESEKQYDADEFWKDQVDV